MGDLLEVLADVRQWLGLLNQGLVVVDQCQSYTEQDFGALVEQAIPNPQNCLQEKQQQRSKFHQQAHVVMSNLQLEQTSKMEASYFNDLLYF